MQTISLPLFLAALFMMILIKIGEFILQNVALIVIVFIFVIGAYFFIQSKRKGSHQELTPEKD